MSEQGQNTSRSGFTNHVAKKALAPIVASGATAATAYLLRKGSQVWQDTLQPKIAERGGGKAVASEAFSGLRERLPAAATEKFEGLSSKVTGEQPSPTSTASSVSNGDREQDRREREQRRQKRRRALEAGSS